MIKSYCLIGFLIVIPLYGMSKATEELIKSISPKTKTKIDCAVKSETAKRNGENQKISR